MISAGELNKPVLLKSPTSARVKGEKKTTYTSFLTVRAKVEQTNQQRAIEVAPVLIGTDRVFIRRSSDTEQITKDWLVNYDDKDHVVHTIEFIDKSFIKLIVKANG